MAVVSVYGGAVSAFYNEEPFGTYLIPWSDGVEHGPTRYQRLGAGAVGFTLDGSGFTYGGAELPRTGVIGTLRAVGNGEMDVTGLEYSAARFYELVYTGQDTLLKMEMFAGADVIVGRGPNDYFRAFGGDDSMSAGAGADRFDGGEGNDTISGGEGADTLTDPSGSNYIRGDEGDDSIVGGSGFDDINGNQGDDTCVSGGGDDWVVGGKDNDSLVGSAGDNLVYGNLGNDTCEGGAGNDIVRGGQNDDVINGGAGDDYVSGDKGDDTVTGGVGADLFHTFGDAGIDRILDFNAAEGDRVLLDPGTQFVVGQVGADTVINMTGGGKMVLVGVQLSALPDGWIFGA